MFASFEDQKRTEIEKRRLLRLQQVRQQSKLLSKQSIERVQKEKQRQNELLRRRKEQEMKLWREKNIEKLQKVYKTCLEDIGHGHKGAQEYMAQERDDQKKQELQQKRAAQRGKEAAERVLQKQIMKPKKKHVNKLKQKTVSIQTDNNKLHEIGLNLDQNGSSSSMDDILDSPHVNFKEATVKTILSSDDDDDDVEEVKILSDITSEENTGKADKERRERQRLETVDDGYDQLMSDYRSVYGRPHHHLPQRPFGQITDHVRKRTETDLGRPSVRFDEYSNSYKLLDNVRTITDKERLTTLVDNPVPVVSPKKSNLSTTSPKRQQNQRPKFAVPKDQPIRIPGQTRTIPLVQSVAKLRADEQLEKQRQTKAAAASSTVRSKSTGPTTQLRSDYEALQKELALLTKQMSAGQNSYNYSVEKLAKDSRTRQNKMENAFLKAASQQAPVMVVPSNSRQRQSVNVAQATTNRSSAAVSSPEHVEQTVSSEEDDQLKRLQILLGRISEQKQVVQQAINDSKIEYEQKHEETKSSVAGGGGDGINSHHENLLQSLLAHRQQSLEIEARELRLLQMEKKVENLIRECSLKLKRNRTKEQLVEVVANSESTSSTTESSTELTYDQLPKKVIINLGDLLAKKKKKMMKHSSPKKDSKTEEKASQVQESDIVKDSHRSKRKEMKLQVVPQSPVDIQTVSDNSSIASQKSTELDKYLNKISAEKEALEKLDVSKRSDKPVKKKKERKLEMKQPVKSYIECLLKLSKKEVDELSVSSVSSVSTPNASVIETHANRLRAGTADAEHTEPYLPELENFLANNLAAIPPNATRSDQLAMLTELVSGVLKKFLVDLSRRITPALSEGASSVKTIESVQSNQGSRSPTISDRSTPPQPPKVCTCSGPSSRKPFNCICGAYSDSSSPLRKTKINIDDLINDIETLRKSSQSEEILEKYTQLAKVCRKYAEDLNVALDRKRSKQQRALQASGQSVDGEVENQPSTAVNELQTAPSEQSSEKAVNDELEQAQAEIQIEVESSAQQSAKVTTKSKDSGIESRPDTSSDVRGSGDLDLQLSPQAQPTFEPLLKFACENNATSSPRRVEKLSERKKPPVAIERFVDRNLEDAKPHDLSTINEVESKILQEQTISNGTDSVLIEEFIDSNNSTPSKNSAAHDTETVTGSDLSFTHLLVGDLKKNENRLLEYLEYGSPFDVSPSKTTTSSESQMTSTSTTPSHRSFVKALENAVKDSDDFKMTTFQQDPPAEVSKDWLNESQPLNVSRKSRPRESEQFSMVTDTSTHSSFRRMLDAADGDNDLRVRTFLQEPPSEHESLQVSAIVEEMNDAANASKTVEDQQKQKESMLEIDRISGILPLPLTSSSSSSEALIFNGSTTAKDESKDSGKDSTPLSSQSDEIIDTGVEAKRNSNNRWLESVDRNYPSTFFHDAARCLTYEDTQSFELFKTQALEVARSKGCEELSEDLLMWFFVKEVVKPIPKDLEDMASKVENNLKSLAQQERAASAVSSTPTSSSRGEKPPFRIPSSIGTIELSQSSSSKDSPARQPMSLPLQSTQDGIIQPPLQIQIDPLPKYTGTIPKVRRIGTEMKTRPKDSFIVPKPPPPPPLSAPIQNIRMLKMKETAPPNSTPSNDYKVQNITPTKPTHLNLQTAPISTEPPLYTITPYQAGGKNITTSPNKDKRGQEKLLPDPEQSKSFFTLTGTESPHPIASTQIQSQNKEERLSSASTRDSSSLGVLPDEIDVNLMNTLLTLDGMTSMPNFRPEELEAYLRIEKIVTDISPLDSDSGSEENSTEVKRTQKFINKINKKKGTFSLHDFIESEIRSSESSGTEHADDVVVYITSASTSAKKTRASTPRGDINQAVIDNLLSFESNLSTISGISKHINEQKKTAGEVKPPKVTNAEKYASSTHSST